MAGSPGAEAAPFDEAHYRRQLPAPAGAGVLFEHYRAQGWRAGLDPHPLFRTRHYLDHVPAAALGGLDPLSHFMRVGAAAGIPFHPCFDVGHYRAQLGRAEAEAEANPLAHYLAVGAARGLVPCPIFDARHYRQEAGDDPAAAADPLSHYLAEGWRRGLAPHPFFDPDWYMAQPGSGRHSPIPLVDFLLTPPGQRNPPQALADPGHGRDLLAAGLCRHAETMAGGSGRLAVALGGIRSEGWFARDGGSAGAYLAGRRRHRAAGRRRVVFVGHDAGRAGAQILLLRLVEHAAASGLVEPFVILAGGGPLTDAYARAAHVVQARPGEPAGTVVDRLLARLADEPPAGVVVSTVVTPAYVAAFAAAGHPPDVLVYEMAEMYPAETQRQIARHARRLIFGSHAAEAQFRRRVEVPCRGEVIHAGSTLAPTGAPDADGEPVVLGCGTISWRKGVDRFLDVAQRTVAALGNEVPVRFRWVGQRVGVADGGADFWVEYDARRLALGDRFAFVDEVGDMAPLYAGAAMLLCPSRADTFPGVVLEAMASARPVVTFADSGGAPEALADGAGIVVPYGDTAAMADAVVRLLRDPDLRRRIGARARARVAERHRFPDYAAAILQPLVPALRADRMDGTPMEPVTAPVVPEPVAAPEPAAESAPAGDRRLDPARHSVLVVADGSDPEAAVLALNLAAFLRRGRNLVLMLADGPDHAAAARAAADVVLAADAAMLRDAGGIREKLRQAVERFALRRAILVGDLPTAVAATLAGCFLPCVLVPTRISDPGPLAEALLWVQAAVATSPAIARAVAEAHPGRPAEDIRAWPAGRSRIWTDAGPGRFAAAERLRAALAGGDGRGVLVLGSGAPTLEGGIDLFLRTAAGLAGPGAPRFAWVCSPGTDIGPRWTALRRRIAASPRHRHVLLRDAAPSLEPAFEAADLFLATARSDGIPLAAAGAMEHGLPVVAFAGSGALAELLAGDPEAARGLVPALDTTAAAALVRHLATMASARSPLAAAAKRLAAAFPAMADWAERIDRLAAGRMAAASAERRDALTILDDAEFDLEEFAGDAGADRAAAVLRHVRSWRCRQGLRRPAPGIHPGLLPAGPDAEDPYAAHIRAGRPPAPGRRPLIRPAPPDRRPNGRGAGPSAALHLHLYHVDQAPDLLRRVAANGRRCDLILTTDTAAKAREIEWAAAELAGRRVRILVLPNRGRDIGAFLTGLGPAVLGEYEVVGHVHGKKTEHKPRAVVEPWRERLLQFLLGPAHPMMDRILAAFADDPGLGLVYPDDPDALGWEMPVSGGLPPDLRTNRPAAQLLARRLGWEGLPEAFDFPAGSMFWARTAALRPLLDLGLGWDDYPPEPVAENATVLHALERLFCIVAERAGYRIAASHVPGFPR
ncbi:rhamnan synthesis F family protein [Stella sp.]|uniref:rhamnan synthesis F family protein n=1 Tax=Stella sp. TaxID=2912054 RepID=UPI0035B2992D